MYSSHKNKLFSYLELLVSMAGFVPGHATIARSASFILSIIFSFYLTIYHRANIPVAIVYFFISEILYVGFLMLVLSEDGLRHWFKRKWGSDDEAYLAYEGLLGLLFFHNAASIGYLSTATENSMKLGGHHWSLLVISAILFGIGFSVKIVAAKVVSIDIYYWKDMFLGRKVSEFVVTGPYKYFSNPMYGPGQIPAYAAAIWYASAYGFAAAILNQALIFIFYYLFEKKFIERIYLSNSAGFS